MKKLAFFFVVSITISVLSCQTKPQQLDLNSMMRDVPSTAKFAIDSTYVWGGSLIEGDDGLYHMFYSTWHQKYGWDAWVTHSYVAHAVSASPFGPFKHKDVALPARGAEYWDGSCTHNPNIRKFGDKYYLYYMGNTGDGKYHVGLNYTHRNNQRIGVAVADSPNGPWKRFDKPVIDVSPDSTALDALMASNPGVTQGPDGGYLMIYKAVGKKIKGNFGGPVVICAATSESPTGPFKKYNERIFKPEGDHNFAAEDPHVWYQDGKYRAIVKDMHGAYTDKGQALLLFDSEDGLNWSLAAKPLVSGIEINWEGGEVQKVKLLDRPQLYLEDGKPVALLCAVSPGNPFKEVTFNVQIPLDK